MGERQHRSEDMATTSTAVTTVPPSQLHESENGERVVITLRPTTTRTRKKVVWTEDTVDNENMNKKKSKCCCIYEKPLKFGESDSEGSDDECEHCFGHVERRQHASHAHHATTTTVTTTTTEVQVTSAESPVTVALTAEPPAHAPPAAHGSAS